MASMENMKNIDNQEEVSATNEIKNKADTFSDQQKKETWNNVAAKLSEFKKQTENKETQVSPENMNDDILKQWYIEKKNKPVDNYLVYRWYPGPHKSFLT